MTAPFSSAGSGAVSAFAEEAGRLQMESLPVSVGGSSGATKEARDVSCLGLTAAKTEGGGSDGLISMEELAEFRDRHTFLSKHFLRTILGELGMPEVYVFQVDRDQHGHIHVNGSIPERQRCLLEQTLDMNEDFRHSFSAAAATSCILESSGQSHDFYEAYERNPAEALERFSWLIGAQWDCRMDYDEGDIGFSVFRTG